MAQIKASLNKAKDVETPKQTKATIDTTPKEPAVITVKKKVTELMQRLHVNQNKHKALSEELNQIRNEGIELVGAVKQFQSLLGDLEQ